MFYLKKLEKEEQIKLKLKRRNNTINKRGNQAMRK